MAWVPKIGRHVQLLKRISDTEMLIKPGVITAFATDSNPIIRVGRHDTDAGTPGKQYELYGTSTVGVPRRTDPDENLTALTPVKYISY